MNDIPTSSDFSFFASVIVVVGPYSLCFLLTTLSWLEYAATAQVLSRYFFEHSSTIFIISYVGALTSRRKRKILEGKNIFSFCKLYC